MKGFLNSLYNLKPQWEYTDFYLKVLNIGFHKKLKSNLEKKVDLSKKV